MSCLCQDLITITAYNNKVCAKRIGELMKRALMVSCEGLGRGGVQAVMMSVIRNLKDEYRFDMLLFTDDVRYYDEEFLSYGGKIFRSPFYKGSNPILLRTDYFTRWLPLYRKIKKLLIDNGPYDVVHCNNGFESAIVVKAAKDVGVPVRIAHAHTCASIRGRKYIPNKIYRNIILSDATHRLACTRAAGICRYGCEDFTVVWNSFDEKKFDRAQFDSKEELPLSLIQVGSFSNNKNQIFTLRVLKAILDIGIYADLTLVGFGEHGKEIHKLINDLCLKENVSVYPADADTPELLSRSYAFMFPSLVEGFGIVLIEAQAMGVRCFVSDSVPRDADAGGCEFLSLEDGAEFWAKTIVERYIQSKTHGRYDCSEFTTQNIVKKYRSIYKGERS